MAVYSYAQLETLWINAGGPSSLAPVAAAIAEAESGGNSDAFNPSGASGLWQILGNPFPGNPFDPATNAKMAVAKWRSNPQGSDNFSPWVTYTDGAYKAFLQGKTTPDPNVPGSPTAVTSATLMAAGAGKDCLVQNPVLGALGSLPLVGGLVPQACLLTKSSVRGWIGAGLMVGGVVIGVAGLGMMARASGVGGTLIQIVSNGAQAIGASGSSGEGAAASGSAAEAAAVV